MKNDGSSAPDDADHTIVRNVRSPFRNVPVSDMRKDSIHADERVRTVWKAVSDRPR